MIATCDKCGGTFDTHHGGTACSYCQTVFCPACEERHVIEGKGTDDPICDECVGALQEMKGLVSA